MKREKIIRKLEAAQGDGSLFLTPEQVDKVATILSGERHNPCPYTFAHTSGWCGYSGCRPGAEEGVAA